MQKKLTERDEYSIEVLNKDGIFGIEDWFEDDVICVSCPLFVFEYPYFENVTTYSYYYYGSYPTGTEKRYNFDAKVSWFGIAISDLKHRDIAKIIIECLERHYYLQFESKDYYKEDNSKSTYFYHEAKSNINFILDKSGNEGIKLYIIFSKEKYENYVATWEE